MSCVRRHYAQRGSATRARSELAQHTITSARARSHPVPQLQPHPDAGIASFRNAKLRERYLRRYGAELPLDQHGFNAGVFVFNLRRWRELNLTRESERSIQNHAGIPRLPLLNARPTLRNLRASFRPRSRSEHWIRANNEEKLYALGSQPPLTLAIHGALHGTGRCQPLPAEWHVDCLGCMGNGRIKTKQQLARAKLFHWNGPRKPFQTPGQKSHRIGMYPELFTPHQGKGSRCETRGGESEAELVG